MIALAQGLPGIETLAQSALRVMNIVVTILFVLAIAAFAWGIVKMVAASGDPEKVKEAKGIIIWGVIAIAVLAALFGLIRYLREIFGVADVTNPTINVPVIVNPGS